MRTLSSCNGDQICWVHSQGCSRYGGKLNGNPFQDCQCNFGKFTPDILNRLQDLIGTPPRALPGVADENNSIKYFRPKLNKRKSDLVADFFGMKTGILGGKSYNPNLREGRDSRTDPGLLFSCVCENLESGRSLWGRNGVKLLMIEFISARLGYPNIFEANVCILTAYIQSFPSSMKKSAVPF